MRENLERHAAAMRLGNAAFLLERERRRIEGLQRLRKLTDAEVKQLIRDFWERMYQDKKKAGLV